jgi:hypothetical protein
MQISYFSVKHIELNLKGTVHMIFSTSGFFHESVSPKSSFAYLPPVSTTPAVPVAKFAAFVVDTGGAPSLANIFKNFRKKSK